ncbi:WD repeat domain-containing 83 [Micractinium conductrix]|uniref:WD repeat domain-containing 83 n=1 Tax=Micractinium conductrix TaxID=554055 RepID=A0A2P6VJJ3_9CHLO|nr:WD repeat domain-containing 83 [Micractinium conductrix]|eukprot:PSC74259.1 WD repeat domain-containing 83 [Micractinium conductrix]
MSGAPLGPAPPPGSALPPNERLPCREHAVLTGHEGPVLAVRFNRQGTYALSGGKDRSVRLWNPHRGIPIKVYAGHGYEVRDVAVAGDNSKFASCGGDRQVFLWDVSTGAIVRKFRGHDATINALCYGAGGEVLVSGGYDAAVKVWDCRSRSIDPIQTMRAFRDSVTSVALTERAEILAGSVDGSVRRFDVRMGRVFTDELHHPVTCVQVSRDHNCVLAACMDGTLRLLDRADGDLLAEYTGHKHASFKMDCAFSPSDAYVIGSSEDGRVFYWELVDAQLVDSFQAHADVVCSLAMHPKGECLLTSSVDGTIKVWT